VDSEISGLVLLIFSSTTVVLLLTSAVVFAIITVFNSSWIVSFFLAMSWPSTIAGVTILPFTSSSIFVKFWTEGKGLVALRF